LPHERYAKDADCDEKYRNYLREVHAENLLMGNLRREQNHSASRGRSMAAPYRNKVCAFSAMTTQPVVGGEINGPAEICKSFPAAGLVNFYKEQDVLGPD
jgi:hypothetical protein